MGTWPDETPQQTQNNRTRIYKRMDILSLRDICFCENLEITVEDTEFTAPGISLRPRSTTLVMKFLVSERGNIDIGFYEHDPVCPLILKVKKCIKTHIKSFLSALD